MGFCALPLIREHNQGSSWGSFIRSKTVCNFEMRWQLGFKFGHPDYERASPLIITITPVSAQSGGADRQNSLERWGSQTVLCNQDLTYPCWIEGRAVLTLWDDTECPECFMLVSWTRRLSHHLFSQLWGTFTSTRSTVREIQSYPVRVMWGYPHIHQE